MTSASQPVFPFLLSTTRMVHLISTTADTCGLEALHVPGICSECSENASWGLRVIHTDFCSECFQAFGSWLFHFQASLEHPFPSLTLSSWLVQLRAVDHRLLLRYHLCERDPSGFRFVVIGPSTLLDTVIGGPDPLSRLCPSTESELLNTRIQVIVVDELSLSPTRHSPATHPQNLYPHLRLFRWLFSR